MLRLFQKHNAVLFVVFILALVRIVVLPMFAQPVHKKTEASPIHITYNPFTHIDIEAAAAYVFDMKTNTVLYQKNGNARLPIASLTKLMTALIAHETLSETARIVITPNVLLTEGESGLIPFEEWQKKDIIDFMLVASSNDAAAALAQTVRITTGEDMVTLMNERAEALDLAETRFLNPTGLDLNNETTPGAYGSARDITILLAYITKEYPELIETTRQAHIARTPTNSITHTFTNTNESGEGVPWLIAAKTGFTNQAGGNLATIFDAGLAHPIAVVVLGSTREARFVDMGKIITATLETFSLK